jgi:branched-chain amino acid transport system ATP-binding protein
MSVNSESLVVSGLRVVRAMKEVIHGVDLEIKPGQVTTLLGANGAGKSSTVLAIAGVLKPTAGTISVGGTQLTGKAPHVVRALGVAAVPEGHRVLTDLTVDENLRAAAAMHSKSQVAGAVAGALDVFPELAERLGQRAGTLSGGQQQMVSLAQALVSKPKFLLADELSLGLAPLVVKRLVQALRRIAADGTGVLLIEQFTTIALDLATDAYLMERGSINWSGSAQTLKEQPELLHAAYLAGSASK